MINTIKFFWEVLKETFDEWNNSSASKDSASLAYYAIFSIPGLLIIIIWIAGNFFGEEAIRGEISNQISGLMGTDVAKSIEGMIAGALIDKQNIFMKIVGIGSLVFGSTTLFFQLQHSLNTLWDVEAAPKKALLKFILDRANSLGMILILGFLLMITMILSSMISLFNNWITNYFGLETYMIVELVNFGIGFCLVMLLFALMFKVLPDVKISWNPVWKGALLTTVLFTLGKFLLSLYFGNFKPTSAFGTAGTVILIMMWINYSCMLVFFGAEFTKVYNNKKGYPIVLSKHAKWSAAKLYRDSRKDDLSES
ncbi:YihY/virulence factor BrkB family protein [Chryseobacterium carnipullorum]|uniref:YihY family inner membrane protein n=1 Tax=Chryseobacterium carnipullorum TaxID=1124835 RepID=A0A376DQS9_CHRCU|nr:YihY/virulence factor BrkB family protein [Chryseobacterium carnipullorum]AZA48553.1 YihY/virulence factor BrkB family protein [Chryseobacterium carnipullorum]AZA63477.1 YihY/virulence factor BrkB family protein [Chryseobacterium carnipullorum]STC92662.1 YihY family inner membrane protein [Chryseobacterium carnipullorum]HBV15081.1 ribonuclease BN [Chryseobacterium carnipullorum]